MRDDNIRISYVVIDDIDFKQLYEQDRVDVPSTEDVVGLVDAVRIRDPQLQQYASRQFRVLRILKPIPAPSESTSDVSRRHGRGEPLSIEPILQRLRDRTREAEKTELSNEYVKVLHVTTDIEDVFKHEERKLLTAILVRLTTTDEKDAKHFPTTPAEGTTWRCKNLLGIIGGSPPSETSGPHGTNLRKYALMGRPRDRYTFPVALYDKRLALLQLRLSKIDVPSGSDEAALFFPMQKEFEDAADKFIDAAIEDYPSEDGRMNALKTFLEYIFGADLKLEYEISRTGRSERRNMERCSTMKYDGAYVTTIAANDIRIPSVDITRVVLEVKDFIGRGDSISQLTKRCAEEIFNFKACISFNCRKPYFNTTYFPKIFIGIEEHVLEISTAVCIETVVVNKILRIELEDNFFRDNLKQKLARAAVALQDCSTQLDEYYTTLFSEAGNEHLPSFPSPTIMPSITSTELMQEAFKDLKIVSRLNRDNSEMEWAEYPTPQDMCHNIYCATLIHMGIEQNVVVKIARSYNKAAHECLAKEGLAPTLYRCEHVIGDFIIVVMEHIAGTPLDVREALPVSMQRPFFEKLKRVLKLLGEEFIVHGDLRATNIMLGSDLMPKVIDFDWAAKDGEGLYPEAINDAVRVEWHQDVKPKKKMRLEHDRYAIEKVLGPIYCPSLFEKDGSPKAGAGVFDDTPSDHWR